MSRLQQCNSLKDLANLLNYKPKSVSYILYKIDDHNKYCTFTIPKKSGGERLISKPCNKLKLLQNRLANILYECIENTKPKEELIDNFKIYKKDKNKLPKRI